METWKKIDGFEEYEVSDWGRVRRGERVLRGSDTKGYMRVCLCKDNTRTFKLIHRLVGLAFIPNPDNKPTINHIDHNRSNNHLENLEWATHTEQHIHSPCPIGVSGHRNIYQQRSGCWQVKIQRDCIPVFVKTFPTLPGAIKARDEFV